MKFLLFLVFGLVLLLPSTIFALEHCEPDINGETMWCGSDERGNAGPYIYITIFVLILIPIIIIVVFIYIIKRVKRRSNNL